MFQDLSSCPPAMEAGKGCDGYGLFPGHAREATDVMQAYVQAAFCGKDTWVMLPPDQVPKAHRHIDRPVYKLTRALYGHPDSGWFFGRHCEAHTFQCGFIKIPKCQSCDWHPKLRTFLFVYADDFKMSGPEEGVAECWKALRQPKGSHSGIKMDDPHL